MRWPFKETIYRDPDDEFRPEGVPYLTRWMLFPKNKLFNVYLHKFTQPDWAPDLHDHPFKSIGIGLKGGYLEEAMFDTSRMATSKYYVRGPLNVTYRSDDVRHAIRALHNNEPVWTLFFRGPSIGNTWGFWRGGRWVSAEQYLGEEYYNKENT